MTLIIEMVLEIILICLKCKIVFLVLKIPQKISNLYDTIGNLFWAQEGKKRIISKIVDIAAMAMGSASTPLGPK